MLQMSEWNMHRIGTKIRDLPVPRGTVPDLQLPDSTMGSKETPAGRLLGLDSDGKYLLGCKGTENAIYKVSHRSLCYTFIA